MIAVGGTEVLLRRPPLAVRAGFWVGTPQCQPPRLVATVLYFSLQAARSLSCCFALSIPGVVRRRRW